MKLFEENLTRKKMKKRTSNQLRFLNRKIDFEMFWQSLWISRLMRLHFMFADKLILSFLRESGKMDWICYNSKKKKCQISFNQIKNLKIGVENNASNYKIK